MLYLVRKSVERKLIHGYRNSEWFYCTELIIVASVNRVNKVPNNDVTAFS